MVICSGLGEMHLVEWDFRSAFITMRVECGQQRAAGRGERLTRCRKWYEEGRDCVMNKRRDSEDTERKIR